MLLLEAKQVKIFHAIVSLKTVNKKTTDCASTQYPSYRI